MKFHFTSYPIFLLGTIIASHMCQMSDAIYIDGMVRLFRGEGNYNDDINSQHATLSGSGHAFSTQTLPTGTQARQVMYFDGNGRANGSATGLPEGAAHRTIIAWFKTDRASNPNGPFGYGQSGRNNAYYALISGGDQLELDQWCPTEGNFNPIISPVVVNTWYHVVISWDGTYNRAYVNGVEVTSGEPDELPDTQLDRVTMGGNPTTSTSSYSRFGGYIADFAIFNRAITASEVASIYNAPEGLTDGGSLGDSCTSDSNCRSGLSCDSGTSTCKVSIGNSCSAGNDCFSGFCAGSPLLCTDGEIGSTCGSGSDCISGFCSGGTNICTSGGNGASCASGSDCTSGYCSPTSSTCATRPILDPCHGITCSNHGKCKGNGVCRCENTFIQTNDGKDCACPDGSFLNASVNRCYAPTSSPTVSPTSSPVTASPTSVVTNAPTPETPFDNPCEDGSGTFTVNNNKEVGCEWLSKNKKRAQKRNDIYCALNEVKLMCPSTCDFCSCDDSPSYTFELDNGMNEVGCDWISKNSKKAEKRRAKYCTDDFDGGALIHACTKSCNLCGV